MVVTAKVLAEVHPEGQDEVEYHGRAHRQAGRVNEVQPDAAGRNSESFAQPRADAKGLTLDYVPNLVHTSFSVEATECKKVLYQTQITKCRLEENLWVNR
jgi:hypothetical protein